MTLHRLFLAALVAASPALGQQQTPAGKSTEQQARSYVVSAFMTGAAPAIVSENISVSPALRQRLGLSPDAQSRAVYDALEAGDATLILQYDLERDNIAFIGLPGAVAVAAPVVAPAAPQRVPEAPKPVLQVVEPQLPRAVVKPAAAPTPAARPTPPVQQAADARPVLRRRGPCEIKPVMSDQDLVNCGATPR